MNGGCPNGIPCWLNIGSYIMCNKCYEKYVDRTGRFMLFCKTLENETNELKRLCIAQRYCSAQDKYIPYRQKESCKNFE